MAKTSEYPAKQRQINNDIKSGEYKPCYLVYGDEAYLRLQNRDKLKAGLMGDADSMNLGYYEGAGISPEEVIDMAETMPFLAERRVIIIETSGFFKHGCKPLADYIKNQAETVNFIFVEESVDKRCDLYKVVKDKGFEINCEVQTAETLGAWINGRLRAEGRIISPRALAFLIGRVGTDMAFISNELLKLVSYTDGRDEITEQDIDAVCANWLTGKIFDLTDAIVSKDQKRAMSLYYDLLALKEPAPKILVLITRQFNIMLQVWEMFSRRYSSAAIGEAVKLPRFVAEKYIRWARSYTYETLRQALDDCVYYDEAVKRGLLDKDISVEMLIVKCTNG